MRLTHKFLNEYFDEHIKPIAPLLELATIQLTYAVKLREPDKSGYRMIVFKNGPKEIYAWMRGFEDSYYYMRGKL